MDSTKQQEDAMPPRECKERKEDRFSYKVIKIAAIITGVATITGAIIKVLGYEFVGVNEFKTTTEIIDKRINKIENDQTRVITKIDAIGDDIKQIKEVLIRGDR